MNKVSANPILSVVIPTYKRPQFLQRAIDSALRAAPDGDVEVLIIPNGQDGSWKSVAGQYIQDSRVQWHPIKIPHANVARNHGLARATGKYIRFLDDDDYFLDDAAQQCIELDSVGNDVSQGGVNLIDHTGTMFHQWKSAAVVDYSASILRPNRITATCAMLYRRSSIQGLSWEPTCHIGQDTAWALSLARDRELSLHRCDLQTGVWIHHLGDRISTKRRPADHNRIMAEILLDTVHGLQRRSALTNIRRDAAAEGLWLCIHNAFPFSPIYWSRMIKLVQLLAPGSHPNIDAFYNFPLNKIDPLWIEWVLAPHRAIRMHSRQKARDRGRLPPW